MNRRRFYWMLGFIVVALVVAVGATVLNIQQELLIRGQTAIAAAGIPYYDLRMDGRDAVLAGFVSEDTDVEHLRAVVAAVPGIEAVRTEITVERVGGGPAAAPADRSATARTRVAVESPTLRAQRLGDLLIVSGRLPDDGSAAAFEDALHANFPASTVRFDVRPRASVATREWTGHTEAIAAAWAQLGDPSQVSAYGEVVQLAGAIRTPRARAQVDRIIAGAPEVEWELRLTPTWHSREGGVP